MILRKSKYNIWIKNDDYTETYILFNLYYKSMVFLDKETAEFYKSSDYFDTKNYYDEYLFWQINNMHENKFLIKENVMEMNIANYFSSCYPLMNFFKFDTQYLEKYNEYIKTELQIQFSIEKSCTCSSINSFV